MDNNTMENRPGRHVGDNRAETAEASGAMPPGSFLHELDGLKHLLRGLRPRS